MKTSQKIWAAICALGYLTLVVNSASHNTGWMLVGEIFGWFLLVGGLWLVENKCLKNKEDQQ